MMRSVSNSVKRGNDVTEYIYDIGGQKYRQEELVWGQVEQLLDIIKDLRLSAFTTPAIVAALGEKISEAVAVVLIPADTTITAKTRDIKGLANELRFVLKPDQIIQVVEDFFACNPIPSLLERVSGAVETIRPKLTTATGLSSQLSACSPAGTSSGGMPSSGGSPPESAAPTSDTAAAS